MQQCSVVSHCGRFDVKAVANRTTSASAQRISFTVSERSNKSKFFGVTLSDDALLQSASSSGFSSSIPTLVKMIFSSLAGASSSTNFQLLTQADNMNQWKKCADACSVSDPNQLIVLQFQLQLGEFGSDALAAFCIPLRLGQQTATMMPPPPQQQQQQQQQPHHQNENIAPQQQVTFASSPSTATSTSAAHNTSTSSNSNEEIAALTQILTETQKFLQQQQHDTAHRMEKIYSELKVRASDCASLRRDVDILKSQVRSSSSSGGGGGGAFGSRPTTPNNSNNRPGSTGGGRFQSPYSRSTSSSRQQQVQKSPVRKPFTTQQGPQQQGNPVYSRTGLRRFDSPNNNNNNNNNSNNSSRQSLMSGGRKSGPNTPNSKQQQQQYRGGGGNSNSNNKHVVSSNEASSSSIGSVQYKSGMFYH